MGRRALYAILCAAAATLASCGVTRYIPEGEYLLNRNIIRTDKQTPRGERITDEELERFVRQEQTRKFLGTNIPAALYSAADTARNGIGSRILRGLGAEPVMLDSAMIQLSAANIESYMRSRGYYDARLDWRTEVRGRKAKVIYSVMQGEPYRIADVRYRFRDESLQEVLEPDMENSLVRPGNIFDMGVLNRERSRIADYLRNRGYYDFSVNNINYLADTTRGDRTVYLTMTVNRYLAGYDDRGVPEYENHTVYRIGEIYVDPGYDASSAISDPAYYQRMDTIDYRGLQILYDGEPKVRERVLRQAINFRPGDLYDADAVRQAYADIIRMGYFRSAAIIFEEIADSTRTSSEGWLKCMINCIPSMRQSYKVELEGSMSSNFFGLGATLGYQNRNLFRGAELFDISLTGRYEFMRATGRTGSYEIGGVTSVTVPRFVSPVPADRRGRLQNKHTRFEMSVDYQDRPIYKRTLSGARLAYSWNNRRYSSFTLRPVDVNLINVRDLDQAFIDSLKNPYLRQSYQSQLAPGISMSWVYNSQLRRPDANSNSSVFSLNVETMGNLFSAVSRMVSDGHYDAEVGGTYYRAFGMRFSQYVRAETSFSNRIVTGARTSFVWRLLAGGAVSYGNSTPMPYDRFFWSGGSNSMRGWIVRRLGPGTQPYDKDKYPSQIGNVKLEANVEFRFPVWDFINSAVFFDLGNIWFAGKDNYDDPDLSEAAVFRFDRFHKQLGLNTGIGLRLDFNRFIFRVDWGIKLHDPGRLAGDRWIDKLRLAGTALNFGVGYPF